MHPDIVIEPEFILTNAPFQNTPLLKILDPFISSQLL